MAAGQNADSDLHHSMLVEDSGDQLITGANVVTEDFLKSSVGTVIDPTFQVVNGGSHIKQTGNVDDLDTPERLSAFWNRQLEEVQSLTNNDFKTQDLPLARIKKIMKMDEDVKMISAEAPLLFSKAAQLFIAELSLRSWIHTEESKRRTLQRNDISAAISKFDQFDFLIDIVPREELKSERGGTGDQQQIVYVANSGATNNAAAANLTQATTQVPGIRTGQLLIAQQNQSGQPLTLTPINIDGTQILQVLQQPTQQAQAPQQLQLQQQQQHQQQYTSGVVLNAVAPSTLSQAAENQQAKQVQISQTAGAEQVQIQQQQQNQQQNLQAILQQLIGNNISTGQGEVHTLQVGAQGQLQLVKVSNQPDQMQTATNESMNARHQGSASGQLFDIASALQNDSGQQTINTVYVTPNQ